MSLESFYGKPSYNPFGTKGRFYHPIVGHRGDDYSAPAHTGIPSWVDGVVSLVGYSEGLGYVIAVKDHLSGVFMGQAHLLGTGGSRNPTLSTGLRVGDRVKLGQIVGVSTARGDDHGELWDGSHCHTTAGWTVRVAFGEGVIRPRPFIENALNRERGSKPTPPAPNRPSPQEEDDMFNDQDRDFMKSIPKLVTEAVDAKLNAMRDMLTRLIQEEGTDARVAFNKQSGIHAIFGLGYFWELGSDINRDTMEETWRARRDFGEATLPLYRDRGLAQRYTHELDENVYDFTKMLCLNFPANVGDEVIQNLERIQREANEAKTA